MASENAIKVFDALPADGSKISGGALKERTGLNTSDLKAAKAELKQEGLVVLGRGRGGTVSRVPGKELKRPEKKSREEALQIAREVKRERTRAQRELDNVRQRVEEVGRQRYPDARLIRAGLYHKDWYVEVWGDRGEGANIAFIEEEALL